MIILTVALTFALALGALLFAAGWATNVAIRKMIGEKHHALEEIVSTGEVPRIWSEPFERKIARLSQDPHNEGKVAQVRARGTKRYLKNLDSLIHYVETSAPVEGYGTREMLLDKLARARATLEVRE
jgi:hypothetical protein